VGNGINENKYPTIVYRGYPVGCAIPKVAWTAASSPESICITDGAKVKR